MDNRKMLPKIELELKKVIFLLSIRENQVVINYWGINVTSRS